MGFENCEVEFGKKMNLEMGLVLPLQDPMQSDCRIQRCKIVMKRVRVLTTCALSECSFNLAWSKGMAIVDDNKDIARDERIHNS